MSPSHFMMWLLLLVVGPFATPFFLRLPGLASRRHSSSPAPARWTTYRTTRKILAEQEMAAAAAMPAKEATPSVALSSLQASLAHTGAAGRSKVGFRHTNPCQGPGCDLECFDLIKSMRVYSGSGCCTIRDGGRRRNLAESPPPAAQPPQAPAGQHGAQQKIAGTTQTGHAAVQEHPQR